MAAFDARPPDLQPRRLMDLDFAVCCPFVLSRLPRIRFLSIGPHLRYGFLQTTPHDDALASRLPFTSIRLGGELTPPSDQTCSAHNKGRCRVGGSLDTALVATPAGVGGGRPTPSLGAAKRSSSPSRTRQRAAIKSARALSGEGTTPPDTMLTLGYFRRRSIASPPRASRDSVAGSGTPWISPVPEETNTDTKPPF